MTPYHILVVDDSEQIRALIRLKLTKLGHTVSEAVNGNQAYEILLTEDIHFVITDWMMPELTGIQLCRKVRETIKDRYVYIILVTAKSSLEDLATGMEAGADDFIAKPFHLSELQARVSAGIRILELERKMLVQQKKLDEAYQHIQKDLTSAARLQRSLLPASCDLPGKFKFEGLFQPSRYLAGDTYNVRALDDDHTLVYILDVAGKGVPAALLSFTLSKVINSQGSGMLGSLGHRLISPLETVKELNQIFQFKGDLHDLQYFTMIYAVINHPKRELRLVQAGHPAPIYVPLNSEPRMLPTVGTPVGLWPPAKATFREEVLYFQPGDRLFLYSDGVSEAFSKEKDCYTEERLLETLAQCRAQTLTQSLASVMSSLLEWSGKDDFDDDVTMCALELY